MPDATTILVTKSSATGPLLLSSCCPSQDTLSQRSTILVTEKEKPSFIWYIIPFIFLPGPFEESSQTICSVDFTLFSPVCRLDLNALPKARYYLCLAYRGHPFSPLPPFPLFVMYFLSTVFLSNSPC